MPGGVSRSGRWVNWARNQRALPREIRRPTTELDLSVAVRDAARAGRRVKAVGAGHSFTGLAVAQDMLIDLSDYRRVLAVDREAKRVTVQSGIRLHELNDRLDQVGLALPNLGDIVAQSISGAVSTGTHGTGARFQTIAAAVVGMRVIAGDGTVVIASDGENRELLRVGRLGLGAIGVLSEMTLQCVDAFALHAIEEPRPIDDVLSGFDEWVAGADHAEFFWFPHTEIAMTKTNRRVALTEDTRPRWRRVVDEEVVQNGLFGALTGIGRVAPRLIPSLARLTTAALERTEYTAPSAAVFASPRRVRFVEMEYAVPRHHLVDAFEQVRDLIDDLPEPIGFPVEVRVLGADDIPLSPAGGRDSGYIAVHVPAAVPYRRYFDGVEAIMDAHAGRPHWGKLHGQTATTLAPKYPEWAAFNDTREVIDPDRRFTNRELERLLGS